jgi:hypothetical protein
MTMALTGWQKRRNGHHRGSVAIPTASVSRTAGTVGEAAPFGSLEGALHIRRRPADPVVTGRVRIDYARGHVKTKDTGGMGACGSSLAA